MADPAKALYAAKLLAEGYGKHATAAEMDAALTEYEALVVERDTAYGAMRAARMALTIGQPGQADKLLAAVLNLAAGEAG